MSGTGHPSNGQQIALARNEAMKDWLKYLRSKSATELWSVVALDFYHKGKVDERYSEQRYLESPLNFIDWIIDEVCVDDCDPELFHKVFLDLSVRLLGSDFGEIMPRSARLLSKFGHSAELEEHFAGHYKLYNQDFDKFVDTGVRKTVSRDHSGNIAVPDFNAKSRICHISDLHFGVHHDSARFTQRTWKGFPRTDYFVDFLGTQKDKGLGFDLLIITGDITSIGAVDEFKQFGKFMEDVRLTGVLPGDSFWDRVVLVPGNHDVLRNERSGKKTGGDRLKYFEKFIASMAKNGKRIRSPFSKEGKGNFGKCALSFRVTDGAATALHAFPEIEMEILTLISCYYSQDVDPRVKELIDDLVRIKKQSGSKKLKREDFDRIAAFLSERIHLDGGVFPSDLAPQLRLKLKKYYSGSGETANRVKLVVAHHNGSNYCAKGQLLDVRASAHFDMLCRIFETQGFRYYLHGHIHEAVSVPDKRIKEISCNTLGGIPEGYHGFNILEYDGPNLQLQRWQLKGEGFELEKQITLTV